MLHRQYQFLVRARSRFSVGIQPSDNQFRWGSVANQEPDTSAIFKSACFTAGFDWFRFCARSRWGHPKAEEGIALRATPRRRCRTCVKLGRDTLVRSLCGARLQIDASAPRRKLPTATTADAGDEHKER